MLFFLPGYNTIKTTLGKVLGWCMLNKSNFDPEIPLGP